MEDADLGDRADFDDVALPEAARRRRSPRGDPGPGLRPPPTPVGSVATASRGLDGEAAGQGAPRSALTTPVQPLSAMTMRNCERRDAVRWSEPSARRHRAAQREHRAIRLNVPAASATATTYVEIVVLTRRSPPGSGARGTGADVTGDATVRRQHVADPCHQHRDQTLYRVAGRRTAGLVADETASGAHAAGRAPRRSR